MQLRPYQQDNKNDIYTEWKSGAKNVLSVNPTGSGKTVIFSDVIREHNGASCAIAHRQELVTQISLALARDDVPHRIIGPKSVVRLAVGLHMDECGTSYYHPSAQCAVAGVDTLIRRKAELSRWLPSVSLWVQDEAHHLLRSNKWGTAVNMFPNAKGLGVTATPVRADGKGLGRHADGVFDTMVEGPTMRELINMGYLTDYRVFAPPSDLDLSQVSVSQQTGEFNKNQLTVAVKKSHIIGDVVGHYLRIARGKLGVTFAATVENATEIATEYNRQGVPAAIVSAKTPDAERIKLLRQFKNRQLLQIVNVDLFGEGFDLPAIEVVSMARPTQSYALYAQQFGRALRLLDGKEYAIIIDHVGNVQRHGLPDAVRFWTLDARERRSRGVSDAIPVTTCLNIECLSVYERIYKTCPYCGHTPTPMERSGPEHVDGDLLELDASVLMAMRGEIARIDGPVLFPNSLAMPARRRLERIHKERQEIQTALRASIAWWAGYQHSRGRSDSESYRRFYFKFGVDIGTAQTLNSADALALADKINKEVASYD